MGRTAGFDAVRRVLTLARQFEDLGISTKEGLERAAAAQERHRAQAAAREITATRRDLLRGGAAAAAVGLLGIPRIGRAVPQASANVGIVGAGLAGLNAADTLATAGIAATIYEARDRVGGRQWSMGGAFPLPAGFAGFPGQVVERGGELIDTTHTTMKGLAKRFKLSLEDLTKEWLPGETTWFFDGDHVPEEVVVDEFRALVDALRPTMAGLSNYITFDTHTDFDVEVDNTTLRQMLEDNGAGPIVTQALNAAYVAEFGREIDRQSCLALLFFMHIDKRSKFMPFGVFSDERYHVIGGNQQIAEGLRASLPGPFEFGMRLTAVRKLSDGRIRLTFDNSGTTVTRDHDAVILTVPYTILRNVSLHASLGLTTTQREIINNFDIGTNAKMNIGFTSRVWGTHDSEGASYSDLPNHQCTWEPNPISATPGNAVMLDYSGGDRAARLDPNKVQTEAQRFLTDLDKVWPGANAAAKRTNGKILAHLQHWPSDPYILGAYTSNPPGYFTEWEGQVGRRAGNVFFAGEHTDSFYVAQGFMEGACIAGIGAANELLSTL